MPLTTMVTPPLPSDPASRKRDIVATKSLIEHRQALEHVLIDGDRVDVVAARSPTSAAALLTVISC